ncbi:MAG: hypothetical protein HQL39_03990 [Alphaproteobacteria bacterium]|nr:hypothetical protein [Alphaproteobacteria bacterium]
MAETETFDASRYLATPEAQAELLGDAFASGNASYVAQALGVIARARRFAMRGLIEGRSDSPAQRRR